MMGNVPGKNGGGVDVLWSMKGKWRGTDAD